MAGRLSFSIAINLLTENFKRGSNQVKAAFRSMQMQILTFAAALGAGGVGLSNLVSRFIDVARETNRVTTALKNVSGGMAQFAENQRFLLEMAKKYGLEINALTGNYAKFTAAASISGMSIMDQRKIFESVSRAVTAFGMSADDSNGVFLALSQMMSKGKISSEELRLQMGERLPVALQAMAKAAGTSVAGLDKLLKKGELMSADVLPKFADALNEMIPNIDTDNLETSVNRLKNTFTEFANSIDIQSKYKSLVDGLESVVRIIQSKISGLTAFVLTLLSGKLLKSIITFFSQHWKFIDRTINKVKVAEEQKELFTQRRIEAEKILEETKTAYEIKENGKRLASKKDIDKAKKALDTANLAEKKAIIAAETASVNAAAVKTTNIWGKATNTIKLGFGRVILSLKSLWLTVWPMALIAAIGALIGKLVDIRKEAKRVKNIFADYQKGLWSSSNTQEVTRMQTLLNIMNDRKKSQDEINTAQSELQKMIGKEAKNQDELNKLVKTRIALLREASMAEAAFSTVGEYTEKNAKLGIDVGLKPEQMERLAKLYAGRTTSKENYHYYLKIQREEGAKTGNKNLNWYKIEDVLPEYLQNLKVIEDATRRAGEHQAKADKATPITPPTDDNTKTELQKIEEKYAQSLRELNARKEVEKMTTDEYNKAYDQLNRNALIEVKSSSDKQVLESKYLANLQKIVDNPVYTTTKVQEELIKVQDKYIKATDLAKKKLDKKLISEDEYRQALIEAATAAANSAISIENIGSAADGFIKKMQGVVSDNLKIETPKLGKRDTTFDYKKSKTDKLSEEVDIWVKYKDDLKEKLEEARKAGSDVAMSLETEFNNAIANVNNLEDALKLAQIQEDVKNFSKELNESMYSGVKDIASSSDRVVNAFSNLRDVMDDVDSTEWEKIMAIWNAIVNSIDTAMSIIHTIENITALVTKLSGAKKEQEGLEKSAINTVGSKVVEVAADQVATEMTIQNSKRKTEAATTEMAAKSTSAYAGIPFAGVALAAGQIAAMTAMIQAARSNVPGFNNGGIYTGGTSFGDKGLARMNKGEMILNMSQQSRLFEAINSGRLGGSGGNLSSTVTTKVRAKDLLLTINNELKSQGKKPIS